jgi:hypothetical protein
LKRVDSAHRQTASRQQWYPAVAERILTGLRISLHEVDRDIIQAIAGKGGIQASSAINASAEGAELSRDFETLIG